MFETPMSSPQMMRMFGLRLGRTADGVACAGVAFGACASAPEVIVAAATSAEEPNRIFRRLRILSSVSCDDVWCRSGSLSRLVMLLSVLHKKAWTHCSASFLVLWPNPDVAGGSPAQFTARCRRCCGPS